MVQQFNIPWAAWYGDKELSLKFPDRWDIDIYEMRDASAISMEDIRNSVNNPIGTASIKNLCQDKNSVAMAVEDISRPIVLKPVLTELLDQLNENGIMDEDITLIYALGGHRPMNKSDSIKKVGKQILSRINIENHHPYENLKFMGKSDKGTPIYINKTYFKADLKIAIGSVLPHPLAGFGGGAKVILPGIAGIDTLEANHQAGVRGIGIGLGIVTELRKDIENVCRKVGLDFSINLVPNQKREIAGLFAGDFIKAHRSAMKFAQKVYSTRLPPKLSLDIGFFNLFPEDTEFSQSLKGLNFYLASKRFIRRGGAIIIMTAATEGRGYHSLQGETGARLYQNWGDSIIFRAVLKKMKFGVFSPNINKYDLWHYYPKNTIFTNDFYTMVKSLEMIYGPSPKVGVFPCSNQMPAK